MNKSFLSVGRRSIPILALLGVFSSPALQAKVPVNLEVGEYSRSYEISGMPKMRGDQTLDLDPGVYVFSNLVSAFTFTVDPSGIVHSDAPQSATSTGNRLRLNTVSIQVDPGEFVRRYEPYGGTKVTGPQRVVSIVELGDSLFGPAGTEIAGFTVAADKTIAVTAGADRVDVSVGLVRFRNVSYSVDPGSYDRYYEAYGGARASGLSRVVGIPGMIDLIVNPMHSEIARFVVNSDQSVTLLSGQGSVRTEDAWIRFNNVLISVDPREYPRLYQPAGGVQKSGRSTFVAIPEVIDRIVNLSFQEIVRFRADENGGVTVVAGEESVSTFTGSIAFNGIEISIEPERYTGGYRFFSGLESSGQRTEVLIPYVAEKFELPGQQNLVSAGGNGIRIDGIEGSPAVLMVAATDGGIRFRVSESRRDEADTGRAPEIEPRRDHSHDAPRRSGGGCVPSAHAGQGSKTPSTGEALGDVVSNPFTLLLVIGMLRRLRMRQILGRQLS